MVAKQLNLSNKIFGGTCGGKCLDPPILDRKEWAFKKISEYQKLQFMQFEPGETFRII